jgi:hypothetical protein
MMSIIPFSPIDPLNEQTNQEFLKLFSLYTGRQQKELGLFYTLFALLIHILRDYPENEDEFLDFCNRTGFIEHAPDYIKDQLRSDNPGVKDFACAFYLSQRQAKDSWEALIDRDFIY